MHLNDIAGKAKIGTTRRGIGPAYEDKVEQKVNKSYGPFVSEKSKSKIRNSLNASQCYKKRFGKELYMKKIN